MNLDKTKIKELMTDTDSEVLQEEESKEEILGTLPIEEKVPDAPVEEVAEQPMEETDAPEGEKPYHESYYLLYNNSDRCEKLDLEGTSSFLRALGFDGGELRQAREGTECADGYLSQDGENKNQMRCSYCGSEIAGVEYYRLGDGRIRCTSCNQSIVKTKEEAQEIFDRIVTNMDKFFGATIDVPVSIEVLDEIKLKRKIGVPLGEQDGQSILILGVAVNKKDKYRILLENGAPRISLIATFAHELTHIWQYTNWDNKKGFKQCPKDKRLLIYEGMAKWAEIQYLYLVGETNTAKREERITRARQDEYGQGFCLYESKYPLTREAMVCECTPFVADQYPFD